MTDVAAIKDSDVECPIPSAWRPAIREIARAFSQGDYGLRSGIPGVAPVSPETASQIAEYIQSYGEQLVDLSETTWDTSVCIWMDGHWDALVDLWTESEGRSDLVLSLKVFETDAEFTIRIYMVYVP
jgi:hypothetical protein